MQGSPYAIPSVSYHYGGPVNATSVPNQNGKEQQFRRTAAAPAITVCTQVPQFSQSPPARTFWERRACTSKEETIETPERFDELTRGEVMRGQSS